MRGRPPAGPLAREQVYATLESLVDKSLLRPTDAGQHLYMLETIREYALEQLAAHGEAAPWRRRHALYYVDLAETASPEVAGPAQATWLVWFEREHDNFRAALEWALDQEDGTFALRLTGTLWRFWERHGHWSEGLRWLEAALARGTKCPPPCARRR